MKQELLIPQWQRILTIIPLAKPLTAKAVQHKLKSSNSTITKQLNKLVKHNLLKKTALDGRTYQYELTEKGTKLHLVLSRYK